HGARTSRAAYCRRCGSQRRHGLLSGLSDLPGLLRLLWPRLYAGAARRLVRDRAVDRRQRALRTVRLLQLLLIAGGLPCASERREDWNGSGWTSSQPDRMPGSARREARPVLHPASIDRVLIPSLYHIGASGHPDNGPGADATITP